MNNNTNNNNNNNASRDISHPSNISAPNNNANANKNKNKNNNTNSAAAAAVEVTAVTTTATAGAAADATAAGGAPAGGTARRAQSSDAAVVGGRRRMILRSNATAIARFPISDEVMARNITRASVGMHITVEMSKKSSAAGDESATISMRGVVNKIVDSAPSGQHKGKPLTITVRFDDASCAGPMAALRGKDSVLPPIDALINIYSIVLHEESEHTLPPGTASGARKLQTKPAYVMYGDGGTHGNSFVASAAFVVRKETDGPFWHASGDREDKRVRAGDEIHARFYPHASSDDSMEFVVALAMCRWAAKNKPVGRLSEIAVIVDSDAVFNYITNATRTKPKSDSSAKLREQLSSAYGKIADWAVVMKMPRTQGNPAALVVSNVRNDQVSRGDHALFADVALLIEKAAPAHNLIQRMQQQCELDPRILEMAAKVRTVLDFSSFYRYRAHTTCPTACIVEWATLVLMACRSIVQSPLARTPDQLSTAYIALLMLPIAHLPTSAPTHRVHDHLANGRPFNVRIGDSAGDAQSGQQQQGHQQQQVVGRRETASGAAGVDTAVRSENDEQGEETRANITNIDSVTTGANNAGQRCAAAVATTESADAEAAAERLVKTITLRMTNNEVGRAMRLVAAAAERDDIPHDQKVEMLKDKFIVRQEQFATPENPYNGDSIRLRHTDAFPAKTIMTALGKMPTKAAPCIDRWTPTLLLQAISIYPEIADLIGEICAKINDDALGQRAGDIIRLGRGIAIPKETSGIRPLTLSCFFGKLAGACVFEQERPTNSKAQYAGREMKHGCEKIVHAVRAEYIAGKAIHKFDIKNAFGSAWRAKIANVLRRLNDTGQGKYETVLRYFYTMYGPTAKIAVYAPGGRDPAFVDFEEGVRQGDSFSAYFFCVLMDEVMAEIMAVCGEAKYDVKVRGYMDDMTITSEAKDACSVSRVAFEVLRKWGFTANEEKSKILCRDPLAGRPDAADQATRCQVLNDGDTFVVLGANITSFYDEYNAKQMAKNARFLDCLRGVPLHPQIAYTLARLCGSPRLMYYASVTPPAFSRGVVSRFQEELIQYVESDCALGFAVPRDVLHERFGARMPDYKSNYKLLYETSLRSSTEGIQMPPVMLVHNLSSPDMAEKLTARLGAQANAPWMTYVAAANDCHMTPLEFRIAMAIRCGTLPRIVRDRITTSRCTCLANFDLHKDVADVVEHALRCPLASRYTFGLRHTMLKQAVAKILREFGLCVRMEPNFYNYDLQANDAPRAPACSQQRRPVAQHHRPDLNVDACSTIAVDFVISCQDGAVGEHAKKAAQIKNNTHKSAVEAAGHHFSPFAVETHGHMDKSAINFIKSVAAVLPQYLHFPFQRRMQHAVSVALAKARVSTVNTMTMMRDLAI